MSEFSPQESNLFELPTNYPEYWEDQYYQYDMFEELEKREGE